MEDPGGEWEIEQYYTSGPGKEASQSKISRILSGGLWLGKKFVITGFVISSAPVVLPPLVVVSVLGFVVSIPFGVVFAGYTCTEMLMGKLLPIPQSSGIWDDEQLDMDRAEEDGVDEGEFVMEEEEKTQIQDIEESAEMGIELVEDGNKEQQQENMMPVMDPNNGRNVKLEGQSEDVGEGTLIKENVDEKPRPVVKRVVVARPEEGETESEAGKNEEAEVLKLESTVLLEKIKDEGKSGESAKKNKKKNKDRLKKALGLGGKKEDKSAKDTKEMEKNSKLRQENLSMFAAGTGGADTRRAEEISTEEENRNIKISGEIINAVLDDREQAPVAEKPIESQSILINGNRSKGNGVPYKVEAAKPSTEISSSEKNLWEQINAIRLVVGYKAERETSLTEELKALYLFTGVELPSSFQYSANIKDAEEKLRFLMSIVGVK